MSDERVGAVYLADDGEPLNVPRLADFELLPNGWITVERNGTTLYYPPGRVDHVELARRGRGASDT